MTTMEDELGDLLVAKGFVSSRYALDLNHGLMVPVNMTLDKARRGPGGDLCHRQRPASRQVKRKSHRG